MFSRPAPKSLIASSSYGSSSKRCICVCAEKERTSERDLDRGALCSHVYTHSVPTRTREKNCTMFIYWPIVFHLCNLLSL